MDIYFGPIGSKLHKQAIHHPQVRVESTLKLAPLRGFWYKTGLP